jgi:hypothetical protein
MPLDGSCTLATDAGMHALWVPEPFADIHDYDTWDKELGEDPDIQRHVVNGNLVPINIGSDGVFAFIVRVGDDREPAGLSEREAQYLAVSSQPYLLATQGRALLSGIEHIDAEPSESRTHAVHLTRGRCSVTIHLIDWKAEPNATGPDSAPADHALPDFVVLINPAQFATGHRTKLTTFDPPA